MLRSNNTSDPAFTNRTYKLYTLWYDWKQNEKTENDIHNFRENDTFAIPFKSGTVECSDKKCKPFRDIVPLNIGWEQEFASKSC